MGCGQLPKVSARRAITPAERMTTRDFPRVLNSARPAMMPGREFQIQKTVVVFATPRNERSRWCVSQCEQYLFLVAQLSQTHGNQIEHRLCRAIGIGHLLVDRV